MSPVRLPSMRLCMQVALLSLIGFLLVACCNTLTIIKQPQSQTVAAGQQARFTVEAKTSITPADVQKCEDEQKHPSRNWFSDDKDADKIDCSKIGVLSYQWYENGEPITGATSASYTLTATAADNGAKFSVVVGDGISTLESDCAKLTVTASTTPVLSTLAGNIGGPGNLNGTGGNARFNMANGIAVDPSGNLYIADFGNALVRKITSAGLVSNLAGTPDIAGFTNGTGSAASFDTPWSILLDSSGNVYIADGNNNAIREITPAGVVTTFATFVHGTYGSCGNTLTNSGGMAFDHAGNILLTNEGCGSITIVSPSGTIAGSYNNPAYVGTPEGIVVDSAGNIFFSDISNEDIVKIDTAGNYSVFAGNPGVQGSADGTGSAAGFFAPYGLAIDSNNNLYTTDLWNSTVRKITPAGVVTTIAGSPGISGATDGTGSAARFYKPEGITVDSAGNLYVNDTVNSTVRKITPAGVVTTLAGLAPDIGAADGTGAAATFDFAFGLGGQLAVDPSGNLYTSQFLNNIVRKITPAGVVTTPAGQAGVSGTTDGATSSSLFNLPQGIAVDGAGNAYVINKNYPGTTDTVDAYTLRKISPSGVTSTPLLTSGDGTTLGYTTSLTADPGGDIYTLQNNTVVKINAAGVITTFAGSTSVYGSTNGTGTAASFNSPSAIVSDTAGNLYLADTNNNLIRKVTPAGVVTTLAGSTTPGINDGTGAVASFYHPVAIATDSAGNVYVGDGPATVRKITPAGVVTTILGVPGEFGITLGATPTLGPITGVAVVGNTLYVTCQSAALLQFPL